MTVAQYTQVSMMLNSFGVQLDDDLALDQTCISRNQRKKRGRSLVTNRKRFGITSMALASAFTMFSATLADHHLPYDCETARDRAKSKYGAVRHHFDTFNRCVSSAQGDVKQCHVEQDAQQGALGDFIFAQRVAQDVCGREGLSGDLVR